MVSTGRRNQRNHLALYATIIIVIITLVASEADGADHQSHPDRLVGEHALKLRLDLPIEPAIVPRRAISGSGPHITTGVVISDQAFAESGVDVDNRVFGNLVADVPMFEDNSEMEFVTEDQDGDIHLAIPGLRLSELDRPTRARCFLRRFGRRVRSDLAFGLLLLNRRPNVRAGKLARHGDLRYIHRPSGPKSVPGIVYYPTQFPKQHVQCSRSDQGSEKIPKHVCTRHRSAQFETAKIRSPQPIMRYRLCRAERQPLKALQRKRLQILNWIQRRAAAHRAAKASFRSQYDRSESLASHRRQTVPFSRYLCRSLIDAPKSNLLRYPDLLSCKPRDSHNCELPQLSSKLFIWRGLIVAPESRCSPYDRDDYRYPQSIEDKIVENIGGIYGPYTGRCFCSPRDTDIEHIVATSEAHDSGLCAADLQTRRRFATDFLNLTLAAPDVNRGQKSGKDAAEWMPCENACWFANRVIQVRRKYFLTINFAEVKALERVLSNCDSNEMIVRSCGPCADPSVQFYTDAKPDSSETCALERWDDDRNGRITCKEARNHGIALVKRGHPAYRHMHDGDGDGQICE